MITTSKTKPNQTKIQNMHIKNPGDEDIVQYYKEEKI